jgi:hypothetical protein
LSPFSGLFSFFVSRSCCLGGFPWPGTSWRKAARHLPFQSSPPPLNTYVQSAPAIILLVQSADRPESRTYLDFSAAPQCWDTIVRLFEENLRQMNPGRSKFEYDVQHLFLFIDNLADISCLVCVLTLQCQCLVPSPPSNCTNPFSSLSPARFCCRAPTRVALTEPPRSTMHSQRNTSRPRFLPTCKSRRVGAAAAAAGVRTNRELGGKNVSQ